jgi:hypothetical protein
MDPKHTSSIQLDIHPVAHYCAATRSQEIQIAAHSTDDDVTERLLQGAWRRPRHAVLSNFTIAHLRGGVERFNPPRLAICARSVAQRRTNQLLQVFAHAGIDAGIRHLRQNLQREQFGHSFVATLAESLGHRKTHHFAMN